MKWTSYAKYLSIILNVQVCQEGCLRTTVLKKSKLGPKIKNMLREAVFIKSSRTPLAIPILKPEYENITLPLSHCEIQLLDI